VSGLTVSHSVLNIGKQLVSDAAAALAHALGTALYTPRGATKGEQCEM
jgi:hypothetical protein